MVSNAIPIFSLSTDMTTHIILGLRIAEVRVIFKLPPHLGESSQHLAYVHWFKPFNSWDEAMGMYRVSRSTRNHKPHAAIISIDRIIQTCQLLPKFPTGAIPRAWFSASGRVMDLATDFYLNRYLNHHVFEDLHPSHRNIRV